ncbi:hypothetical protein B0H65DRAFT_579524, partial [Neurospora tetraspora]
SSAGLGWDEAESGSHRGRQVARSVTGQPQGAMDDGTRNDASVPEALTHGSQPTFGISDSIFPKLISTHKDVTLRCDGFLPQASNLTPSLIKMEFTWSYNNGRPVPNSGGAGQGSYVNDGHIQPDNLNGFDDIAGFGYPVSQAGSDPMAIDFDEPENNHPGFGHSTNHPGVNQPNDNMNQAGIDQMALDFDMDELDSQPDFDIGGLDLAEPQINHPDFDYAHAGKTITQMVNEETNGEYQGYFTSRQHRKELEQQYMQQQAARILATINPASLADLPGDEAKRKEWRQKTTEAIRDFTNVVNRNRIKETKDAQGNVIKQEEIENTHVRRVRTLSLFVTELIADKILEAAEEAHQGNTGIAPWVEKSSWFLEKYPTLDARMQAVLVALRRNKSVPHAYLQVIATNRFVAVPKAEIKDENMTCNGNRGELLREGLKARKGEG